MIVRGERGAGQRDPSPARKRQVRQVELTRRARLRRKTISDLESGAPPSFRSLARILAALDLEIVERRADAPKEF